MKRKLTMREAIQEYFNPIKVPKGWSCKLCGFILISITGISIHWRKTHQHDTKVFIAKMTNEGKAEYLQSSTHNQDQKRSSPSSSPEHT